MVVLFFFCSSQKCENLMLQPMICLNECKMKSLLLSLPRRGQGRSSSMQDKMILHAPHNKLCIQRTCFIRFKGLLKASINLFVSVESCKFILFLK